MPRNGYGHMVIEDYVTRLRALHADREERLSRIRSRSQALAYQKTVRNAIRRAFGPKPARSALDTSVVDTTETRYYTLEKLLFQSRPGCLVTAHMYLPKGLKERAPAVLGTCGHSAEGKMAPAYQEFCQRLARSGFVTLIYDPFNQGERDQYWDLKDRGMVASCTHAHNMMGKQLELLGQWFGAWRAWDGIRALDYLLTRPEVDPERVGLTGNSGGGTMTTWLWAYEPRITMAAPSCFVTTFLANLENELPADCEQYPPGAIGSGLEMADFLIARAPDPVLLLGQKYDFFDRRGLQEAYADVRRFYDILGAPDNAAQLYIGPRPHGFGVENQEAMVDFFVEHAGLQRSVRVRKPTHLEETAGWVTPQGNTVAAGATPIYRLVEDMATQLIDSRRAPSKADLMDHLPRLLQLPVRSTAPHYRILRPRLQDGFTLARYAVETTAGIRAIVTRRLADPSTAGTLEPEAEVSVWLPHTGCAEDFQDDPLAQKLLKAGPLFGIDARGLGESMQDEATPSLFHAYGIDYMMHGYGLLFGESYLGQRVHDVLSVLDLLVAEGTRQIKLYGRGQGALLALFAAVLHDRVQSVVLRHAPLSYAEWTRVPLVAWPSANVVRAALTTFDLPDLMRALGRNLRLQEPWGPDMQPLPAAQARKQLQQLNLSTELLQRG